MECSSSRAHRVFILLPSLEGQDSARSDLSVEEQSGSSWATAPGTPPLAKTRVGGEHRDFSCHIPQACTEKFF